MGDFTGLIETEESRQWLADTARAYAAPASPIEYPQEFDPRGIIRVEFQRQRNSCVGHAASSNGEICAYLDSGGELQIQFSRWGSYIWAQQATGLDGVDEGAEIRGAIKASVEKGFCPEDIWPYPDDREQYSASEPNAARLAAAPYRLMQHTAIRSYDDGFEWSNQGRGGLLIGVNWTPGLRDNTGDVTLADAKGRVIGRHAMFIWGWTADGRMYLGNSHSERWGQRGWRLVRPEVIDYWCQRAEVHGMSDLKDVVVSRPVIADLGEGM